MRGPRAGSSLVPCRHWSGFVQVDSRPRVQKYATVPPSHSMERDSKYLTGYLSDAHTPPDEVSRPMRPTEALLIAVLGLRPNRRSRMTFNVGARSGRGRGAQGQLNKLIRVKGMWCQCHADAKMRPNADLCLLRIALIRCASRRIRQE